MEVSAAGQRILGHHEPGAPQVVEAYAGSHCLLHPQEDRYLLLLNIRQSGREAPTLRRGEHRSSAGVILGV